jgi:hypothetical protein
MAVVFDIHKSVHPQYIPKTQPTKCYVSQLIYFNKMLYIFQAVPPPIIRSSNCTYSFRYLSNLAAACCYHGWDGIAVLVAAKFDKYQKLYVHFELLMMGGGTA